MNTLTRLLLIACLALPFAACKKEAPKEVAKAAEHAIAFCAAAISRSRSTKT